MISSKLNWKYLAQTPIGKHWADKFINFEHLMYEVNKKENDFTKETGFTDPGLGDFRYITQSGNLRNLLGSSMKIEKADGTAVFVMILYMSPSDESDIPIDALFPDKGWKYGKIEGAGVPIPGKTHWVDKDGKKVGATKKDKDGKLLRVKKVFARRPLEAEITVKINPNMCRFAGSCRAYCITTGGKMPMHVPTRYAKTWFWLTQPIVFLRLILTEIAVYARQAFVSDMQFFPRLNGTTDILWERYIDMDGLVKTFPGLGGWYDYTKWGYNTRVKKWKDLGHRFPKSYHLTFSVDEKLGSDKYARKWLEHGTGVAIVMTKANQQKLRTLSKRHPWIIDGDKTDFRFADPPSSLVTLHNKGELKCSQEGEGLLRDTAQINQYLKYIAALQGDFPAPQLPAQRTTATKKSTTKRTRLPVKSKRANPSQEVAQTILRQMGGWRKIHGMTGAKNVLSYGAKHKSKYGEGMGGVSFKFPRPGKGKPNYIKIILNRNDLYDVTFGFVRGTSFKVTQTYHNVGARQLKPIFEKETGLHLSL